MGQETKGSGVEDGAITQYELPELVPPVYGFVSGLAVLGAVV